MYLRPDEVARVLEKVGFTVDVALIIHPTLKERSSSLAEPATDIKTCDHYQQFPLYLAGETHEHYGIPHGFSSRIALERYLSGLFGDVNSN